jgi:hypothetical protein
MNRSSKLIVACGLFGMMGAGCTDSGRSDQEAMGKGIVLGTLGAQPDWQARPAHAGATAVAGQVLALEGGAYVIEQNDGSQQRLSHDENTRIDRPAHVGDNIQVWVDEHGRAVLIRNIDHE